MTARHLLRGFFQSAPCIAMLSSTHIAVAVMGVDEPQTLSRLRPQTTKTADAIAQGIKRSPTFRRLIESIDASDGLVYLAEGTCQRGVRACLENSVTIAGRHRVLRIFVNPQRAPGCQLVEVIGHELQHAVEVLSNPTVRSRAALVNLFDRIGNHGLGRFETAAAVRTGDDVAAEACRG